MAFRSYGGVTWSDQEAEAYRSATSQGVPLAVLAGVGLAGGYAATRTLSHGFRPIDYISATARAAGNLSPFQLFNTFRAPEILSPYTSAQYKMMGEDAGRMGVTLWDKSYFGDKSSYEWLKYATGRSEGQLEELGFHRPGYAGSTPAADALEWVGTPGKTSGRLEAITGGQYDAATGRWTGGTRKTVADSMSLFAMTDEVSSPLVKKGGVNLYAKSVFAAADMYSDAEFDVDKVLTGAQWDPKTGKSVKTRAQFGFVPSTVGPVNNLKDLSRRTVLARSVSAFGMSRFNQLMGNLTEQFLGETGSAAINKFLGVTPGVRPGPASAMFARFGGRAAAAGAIYMGVQQLDWARRNFGMPGEAVASGVVAAGIGAGAKYFGMGGRKAFMTSAAAFFGQMILPGFDQGVMEGIATGAVGLDILRANFMNPFNYLRRTFEGFAPGVTDFETGAGFALAALGAASVQMPGGRGTLAQQALERFAPSQLGLAGVDMSTVRRTGELTKGVRREFWSRLASTGVPYDTPETISQKLGLIGRMWKDSPSKLGFFNTINTAWSGAEETMIRLGRQNPMNEALRSRLGTIASKYGGDGMLQQLKREAAGFYEQAKFSFFGADISSNKALREEILDMGFGRLGALPTPTGRLGRWGTIGAAAMLVHGTLTGGLFGSKETADDLREIYSGNKLVAVKKSRWWEAGGTPFAGGDDEYYRPHAYYLMMNRVREAGTWGADEDDISPIGKWVRKNFSYELEKRQYWDRPYPISSAAFADVPIIGGVLASTVGRLIKPPKIMHAGEWIKQGPGGPQYGSVFEGSRREPSYELGAQAGIPQNPYGAGANLSFLNYQFRELEGMTGWAKNVVQQSLTGEDVWGTDAQMLADASLMDNPRIRFWEAQMGGGLFTNELIRRILPRYRSEIDRSNPLANNMPSWLPDRFKWGDPYRSIEWGEARLPGAGYAARHKELAGVDPEAYPLIHRYAILSDVAPFSPEYSVLKNMVYERRAAGQYSQKEIDYMDAVDARHAAVVNGYADNRVHERAIMLPGSGATRGAWDLAQRGLRLVAAPAEYMVPMGFRPVQKLFSDRDPVSQYEYERMYGTPMAFWDKPFRDWLRPSFYSALNMMGFEGKPLWRIEADQNAEYFDKLEFVKWMSLYEQARAVGDNASAQRYRFAAAGTRAGVNPQGSPLGMYWTLPESERKFFNAFATASGKDRHRIAEMVPEDQLHLYKAIWSRIDAGDPTFWAGAQSSIDDSYMRSQMAAAQASVGQLPAPDWVGWHEDVDMSDIRVRYVDNIGGELADYGLWESQLKKSMQQPFLEGSAAELDPSPGMGYSMRRLTGGPGMRGTWQAAPWGGSQSSFQLEVNDNRQHEISSAVASLINGY